MWIRPDPAGKVAFCGRPARVSMPDLAAFLAELSPAIPKLGSVLQTDRPGLQDRRVSCEVTHGRSKARWEIIDNALSGGARSLLDANPQKAKVFWSIFLKKDCLPWVLSLHPFHGIAHYLRHHPLRHHHEFPRPAADGDGDGVLGA